MHKTDKNYLFGIKKTLRKKKTKNEEKRKQKKNIEAKKMKQ